MSFGENIQFLRKRKNLTQEDLADQLQVSRQTVSKWEQDGSFPEMDKILQLCDLLGCDMDTLLRGNAEQSVATDTAGYDRHMNRFAVAISCGVGFILLGVTTLLVLFGLGFSEIFGAMIFMCFVVVSVTLFIVSGIMHSDFIKRNPHIQAFYPEERIRHFDRRFPLFIAIPIACILLGVVWIIGASALPVPAGFFPDNWAALYVSIFMFDIAVSVPFLIYGGMQKAKYDLETYNKENAQDEETKRENERIGKWTGSIMMLAVIVFLLLGFLFDLWNIAWIVFPVGGILCGIVSTFLKKQTR